MKKFEEEIFGKVETMITQPGCSMTRKVWYSAGDIHDFSEGWVSPEDHQAEIDKRKQQYEEYQEIYSKTAKKLNEAELELSKLKSQLEKQQPEIPEFVANYIEAAKEDFWTLLSAMDDSNLSSRVGDWLKGGNFRNQEIFALAWTNGYTVKEKRFYLKHIDFCKRHKDYDWYMIKHSDGPLNHLRVEKGTLPPTVDTYFTQQEIDSMETGSYEQIEVEEKA
ncbi:DUF1642 domain-containing protein [Lactococcus formosensis]|uniref:DUF1642 domain-containing protein n=1 Tax=Lactococcus formosensis TaxID=1281486 RepID=UPI002550DCC3|nr:DUF1642 domain-containing protein [Lactococcus formosensis]